ncbi:MAG TPA: hypothetical protein VGN00_05200 [Puia sp.]|jgi:hypothetical protein
MQLKMRVLLGFAFSLLIAGSMLSCKKGDTGPAGPAGPAGPTGAQGPIGNANVFVDTFSLASADWLWNSGYTYSNTNGGTITYFTRYHDVTFSKLTQGIIDSGMVLVYIAPNLNNLQQYSPMPYSYLSFGSVFYYNYVFETFVGKVRLHFFYTQNSTTAAPTTLSTDVIPTLKYKIVVVAGTVATTMKAHDVDVKDYNAVNHFLNP